MPRYELRPLRRISGRGLSGRWSDVVAFEAADDNAAITEGRRRAKLIGGADLLRIVDTDDVQVDSWDA